MQRLTISICTALAIAGAAAFAQDRGGSSDPRTASYESRESNAHFFMNSNGTFGYDAEHNRPGLIVPRGGSSTYLFGSGLWFGARKRVGDEMKKLTFVGYNPNSGAGWGTPGPYNDAEVDIAFFNSLDYNRDGTWKPLTTPATQNWPLWLLPGMRATPLTPGVYEPADANRSASNGTYSAAAFMPGVDEQIVLRYSDKDLSRYEITDPNEQAGYPLGLEIQQNIYAWKNGLLKNAVVLQYRIINRSSDTLRDCVVGQVSDADLGQSVNDFFTFDDKRPELRMSYAWTSPESGQDMKTLVMSVLEAPQTDSKGRVDNSNRLRYMLTGRVASCPPWNINTDPKSSAERYDFMTSNRFADNEGPGDQRALMASGTFTMLPGDTAHFAYLYLVEPYVRGKAGRDHEPHIASSVATVEDIVASITSDYYSSEGFNSILHAPGVPGHPAISLSAFPNPARDAVTIDFTLERTSDVTLRLVNSMGETVMTRNEGVLAEGEHAVPLDLRELVPGIYFVSIDRSGATNGTRVTIVR
jgi:hypothetical protein